MKDPGLESLPPKFGLFFSMHTMYSTYRLVLVSSASLDSSLFPFLRCSVLDYVNLLLFFFFFSLLFLFFFLSFFSLSFFFFYFFLKNMKLLLLSVTVRIVPVTAH